MRVNKEDISVYSSPHSIPNHLSKTFTGYQRSDGCIGTANYWLFIPTVFCENRNLDVIKEAMRNELGYTSSHQYSRFTRRLLQAYEDSTMPQALSFNPTEDDHPNRVFKNVDGIKFLNHSGGCGGTRQDSALLSSLLAAYANHPNVGGVTILSLGCQHLQIENLMNDLKKRNPCFDKPLYIFEQQQAKSEEELIAAAIRQTFSGLIEINRQEKALFPVNQLSVGIVADKGITDISALAPAIGYAAGLFMAMGCKVLLNSSRKISFDKRVLQAVFPKNKTGNDLQESAFSEDRIVAQEQITNNPQYLGTARKPSNVSSVIVDLLDYGSAARLPGLNLVGPSANTAEAITGIVASGATVVIFQTENSYVRGNPLSPVVTVSTVSPNNNQQDGIGDIDADIMDVDEKKIVLIGETIFQFCIDVASAKAIPKSVALMHEDFVPVRTGVSL